MRAETLRPQGEGDGSSDDLRHPRASPPFIETGGAVIP